MKEIDPVSKGNKEGNIENEDLLDASKLSLEDFQSIPPSTAIAASPFEGYPMEDIKIMEIKKGNKVIPVVVKKTYIVALSPSFFVPQDPSGKNTTLTMKDGTEKMVDLKTSHNRTVVDRIGQNIDVVFDNILITANGKLRYAIVPDHSARAQIVYKINAKQESRPIMVDNRYLLLDIKQKTRLRKVFAQFYYQQTKTERAADRFYEQKGDGEEV
jgi:hypothetical protein